VELHFEPQIPRIAQIVTTKNLHNLRNPRMLFSPSVKSVDHLPNHIAS
jgi:hypothetical protein